MSDTPAQIEAKQTPTVEVVYGDLTFTFPASLDDSDGDVLEAVEDGRIAAALRGLLADEQWAVFKKTKPKVRDYTALFDAYFKAIGLDDAGN